jgi:hypothetical protein
MVQLVAQRAQDLDLDQVLRSAGSELHDPVGRTGGESGSVHSSRTIARIGYISRRYLVDL